MRGIQGLCSKRATPRRRGEDKDCDGQLSRYMVFPHQYCGLGSDMHRSIAGRLTRRKRNHWRRRATKAQNDQRGNSKRYNGKDGQGYEPLTLASCFYLMKLLNVFRRGAPNITKTSSLQRPWQSIVSSTNYVQFNSRHSSQQSNPNLFEAILDIKTSLIADCNAIQLHLYEAAKG